MSSSNLSWLRAPFARLGAWRERRALERRAIPEPLWQLTLARLPFLGHLDAEELDELRRLCSLFLDQKTFTGAAGVEITDELALCVAAQACLPVIHLGLHYYRGFAGIVVHEDEVVAPRSEMDEDGIVHEYDEALTGQVDHPGMMVLNLVDLGTSAEAAGWAYNVVIHEFVHVIDAATGDIDGVPPLRDAAARDHWIAVIDAEYDAFCALVDDGVDTAIDPYGAEGVDEFFAVAAEAFFVDPLPFKREAPALYELLAGYFKQDPAGP